MKPVSVHQQPGNGELLTRTQLLCDPCALKMLSAAELMEQTDSMVLWVEGGDHSWKDYISIVESRYYAAELTKFIRHSGDTECTHAMGAADLVHNLGKIHEFGKVLPVFVAYNHDRLENNRGIVTAEDIVETCLLHLEEDHRIIKAKDISYTCLHSYDELKDFAIWALNEITDSPHLHGINRLAQQVRRANRDTSGFIGEQRILEKEEALNRELYNAKLGILPFRGNKEKTKNYLTLRIDTIDAIKSPHSKEHKKRYMATALELTKELRRIETSKKPARDNYWFTPSSLLTASSQAACHVLSYCDTKRAARLGLSTLAL